MAWVILEGLDRTGKSTIAELYKKRGYEVVHMTAPSKKYREPGYAGPSYLDDLVEMVMKFDGKDVIFDRSWYGELVWPFVYGRDPMLDEDGLEVLREFEDRNEVQRILMIDPDTNAHWKRCVDNKEPMNHNQFKIATSLFNKLAHKWEFIPRQLGDFDVALSQKTSTKGQDNNPDQKEQTEQPRKAETAGAPSKTQVQGGVGEASKTVQLDELQKLEKANAINDVLSKRIVKQKGGIFDKLEDDIRSFLRREMSSIFNEGSEYSPTLSLEEITIVKAFCQRIKEKEKK